MRHLIVERREQVRGRLLNKVLEQLRHQRARRSETSFSWRGREKHTTAWLLCLPGPDHSLSNEEFSEAVAALLCLPKGGRRAEKWSKGLKWGDNVVSAAMAGDGWRKRHDSLKLLLRRLVWAGIHLDCKVFNLFASSIPRMDSYASLVGDVRFQLSLWAVQQQARLLIDKLAVAGNGTGAAAQRLDWAVELEAAASRRRRAQEVSRRQGRNIVRHGFGLI